MNLPEKPWLGAAYYPEDWPDGELDKDIAKMGEVGINLIRIGEFAWHRMEPVEGRFDFSYFHRVIDRAKAAGLAVIMGTPTATPPHWFVNKYPEAFMEDINGRRYVHGGRRHCCSNSPVYNEYSLRIVEEMAKEFADEEAIVGWQLDNEIYTWSGCFCPECVKKFRAHLKQKFKDIDALNEAWNLNLFSQWYEDFDHIPAPRDAWHNPHLVVEWRTFQQNSHVEFIHKQADILHKYVRVPVGTDIMPFDGINYAEMFKKLDVVQFNHYNAPENLYWAGFWFDYLRTMKPRPFWNTETAACWNGSTCITQSIKPDGFCRANSWLPVAMGGEANCYWLWRTHWAGHELMHGSVIDTSGCDMLSTGEVRQTARDFARAADFLKETGVKSRLALHFSSVTWNMHEAQSIVAGWKYDETVQKNWYVPMAESGLRPDVIDPAHSIDGYRLIFSPMIMTLEDENLGERMAQWVKNGGTWVVGPLTDVRNIHGARYRDRYFGMLEELTGAKWSCFAPDIEGRIKAEWKDGSAFTGKTWYEFFDEPEAEARVTAGHRAIEGKALIVSRNVGKGRVIILGTIPSPEDMKRIIGRVCGECGIEMPAVSGSLMVIPREGPLKRGVILVEYGNAPGSYTLSKPAKDLLTGREFKYKVPVEPYEVLVLEEIR